MNKEEIRTLRRALGLTQEALATRLGVDRSAVAQWENGYTHPRGPATILLRQFQEEAKRISEKVQTRVDRRSA